MPEISIIVPIYNVEKYLHQCLSSIKNQTFTDWECILINDETPDNSAVIIDEFLSLDTRFKVINRQNGGLSAARNSGLALAQGKYIIFVDADDWIEPCMLEVLYSLITEHNADMAQIGYLKEYDQFTHKKRISGGIEVIGRRELVTRLFYDKSVKSYMWNKIYRREVITDPFPEGKVFEDMYTLSHWIKNIYKTVCAPDMLYHYRYRKGSIANKASINNKTHYIESRIEQIKTFEEIEPGFVSKDIKDNIMWKSVLSCIKSISRMQKIPFHIRYQAITDIKDLCLINFGQPDKKQLGFLKYRMAHFLLNYPKTIIKLHIFTRYLDLHSWYRRKHAFD